MEDLVSVCSNFFLCVKSIRELSVRVLPGVHSIEEVLTPRSCFTIALILIPCVLFHFIYLIMRFRQENAIIGSVTALKLL